MLEELAFVNPNKAVLRRAQREQVSVDSFRGALVTPRSRAAASAAAQRCAQHTGTRGYLRRRHLGKSGGTSAAGFGHHRRGGGEEQGRGRRTEESPRVYYFAPPQPFFVLTQNVVVIKTSPSPRQALLIAQLGWELGP